MDVADFDAWYAATAATVTRQVFFVVGDLELAQRRVRDAYARAWVGWDRIGATDASEAWVRRTALRLHTGLARRMARAWPISSRTRPIPTEALVYAAREQAVAEALRRLPERQRIAVVLHHLADLDVPHVAEEMESTAGAALSRLQEARATLGTLLPHLLSLPDTPDETIVEDPLSRYLHETAERCHPVLPPAADVRARRWRRRYYRAGLSMAAALAAVTAVVGTGLVMTRGTGTEPGSLAVTDSSAPATTSGRAGTAGQPPTPPSQPPSLPSSLPSASTTPPVAPSFTFGATAARASDIPPNRRDLGYLDSWFQRDGGVLLRFDRILLRTNGTIENENTRLRELPLATGATVRGGRILPAQLTIAELLALVDDGAVRSVVFVLHYDAADQVDRIEELLRDTP